MGAWTLILLVRRCVRVLDLWAWAGHVVLVIFKSHIYLRQPTVAVFSALLVVITWLVIQTWLHLGRNSCCVNRSLSGAEIMILSWSYPGHPGIRGNIRHRATDSTLWHSAKFRILLAHSISIIISGHRKTCCSILSWYVVCNIVPKLSVSYHTSLVLRERFHSLYLLSSERDELVFLVNCLLNDEWFLARVRSSQACFKLFIILLEFFELITGSICISCIGGCLILI